MVKLIACDIDGTVLEPDERILPHELLEQAERLMKKGIVFCFSSGRQFSNLRVLAQHLVDRFYYICDNGAVVYSDGKIPEIISLPYASTCWAKTYSGSTSFAKADMAAECVQREIAGSPCWSETAIRAPSSP